MDSVLLHACCAPCSIPAILLQHVEYELSLYYYNPNIAPPDEYIRRRGALFLLREKMPEARDIRLIIPDDTEPDYRRVFREATSGLENEPEGGARCRSCIELRLRETAKYAAEHNFAAFGTTLTTGPRKPAAVINPIGEALAAEYGIRFLPLNLKKRGGYEKSVSLSREYGIYRQNYCGCKPFSVIIPVINSLGVTSNEGL